MKYIIGLICFSSILFLSNGWCQNSPKYVGIFYTKPPPEEAFYLYDWLIIDPYILPIKKLKQKFYLKRRAKLISYLSIGEIGNHDKYYNKIKKDWILGKNKTWNSIIFDLRNKEYKTLLLKKIIPSLIRQGYEGLMLDTLDSYQLVLNKKDWKEYEKEEIDLIKEIRKRYPHIIIIVNRPFYIIDQIKNYIDAFLAESLFYGLDSKLDYTKMKEEDTKWLLQKLNHIKSLGIPIIVVDYVDPNDKILARKVAKKIKELGFIPWVTDKDLSIIGIGACELEPRRIILFYDSRTDPDPALSPIHRLVQMPLEWLGFVPELYDINKELPDGYLGDRYIGIIVWVSEIKNPRSFYNWIKKKTKEGLKIFFIDNFGFPTEGAFLKPFGIEVSLNKSKSLSNIEIIKKADIVGFESEPIIEHTDYLLSIKKGIPLIVAKNSAGQKFIPLAITPWGGYAMPGTSIISRTQEDLWVVNPIALFKLLFKPIFPAPDITTENGRRILTAHIDGDSFFGDSEFDPSKTTGEIIRDQILKVFKIPHTVSIIEGETAPWGLYPKKSKRLEKIARSIFKLPNVEPATHTFSHPFFWKPHFKNKILKGEYKHNLPIKNYKFNIKREIIGSVKYINNRLLLKGKSTKVLLWSGDCLPSKEAVKITYEIGIYNVNGGDTTITNQAPFLSHISPMGLNLDEYFQVYAPILNENLYTNLWHGPYYGYINVISTFKLTEKPKRIKPISIYYHFYSGQKLASLKALKDVYKWALSQEINPVFLSEYAQKVLEFRGTAIARDGDFWIIRNGGHLRTLRISTSLFPVLSLCTGVVGYKKINNDLYIHLDGSGDYRIYFGEKRNQFYLYDANAKIEEYKRKNNNIIIKLKGYLPIDFRIVTVGCKIKVNGGRYKKRIGSNNIVSYKFIKAKEAIIEAICKN